MQGGRRFPGPNRPPRGGAGLLGDAPPGYGPPPGIPPPGIPPPGIPPPGVPPPPMPGGTVNAQQPGIPRVPPQGVPPVMSQPSPQQQSPSGGLTSPIPGSVPPRIGFVGQMSPFAQPPPQAPGMQQTQQQQQQGQQASYIPQQQPHQAALPQQPGNNNPPAIPGFDNAFRELGANPTSALALVNEILRNASAHVTSTPGPNNPTGVTASITTDITRPPPPLNNNATQISGMHNSQTAQQLQQQLQAGFSNINNTGNAMASMNNMPPQQYNSATGGSGISGASSSMGGPIGSTSIATSQGLNLPGAMQTNGPFNTSTNSNSFDNGNSTQIAPPGSTTTPKVPLLPYPPGVDIRVPPPTHHHGANQRPLLPNPSITVTNLPQQSTAPQQPVSNNSNNGFHNGLPTTGLLGTSPGQTTQTGIRASFQPSSTGPHQTTSPFYGPQRRYNQHQHHPYQRRGPGPSEYGSGSEFRSDHRSNSRGRNDRRDSASPRDSSGKGKSSGLKSSEEYDPAEPTEDNQSDGGGFCRGIKRHRSPTPHGTSPHRASPHGNGPQGSSDLTVTVNRQGRSVSQDGGSSAKRHKSGGEMSSNESGTFHCNICRMDVGNQQDFHTHMESEGHRQQLGAIQNRLGAQIDMNMSRMRAGDHIKRLEGKDVQDYCRICDKHFPNRSPGSSYMGHRRSQEHRRKERLTRRGCKLCDTGQFHQYPEYVKHIDSEPHKKKKELLRKNNETCSSRSSVGGSSISGSLGGDEDTESNMDSSMGEPSAEQDLEEEEIPNNIDDMELQTVDATGCYASDNEEVSTECRSNRASPAVCSLSVTDTMSVDDEKPVSREVEDNAPWRLKSESSPTRTAPAQAQSTIAQAPKAATVTANTSSNRHPIPVSIPVSYASVATSSSVVSTSSSTSSSSSSSSIHSAHNASPELKKRPLVQLIDPSKLVYDGESPVGVDQIIPVSGFFCKICAKFYRSEGEAKETHCQSKDHFEKYQKLLINKAKSASPCIIPNGQYKRPQDTGILYGRTNNADSNTGTSQERKLVSAQHVNVNTNNNSNNNSSRHSHNSGSTAPKAQRTNAVSSSKACQVKDNHHSNTDPLVCKNTPPVRRTIQVKPDHDIKVDINANSNIDEEKPKINGGVSPLNNNDEYSVDNELPNGDEMFDLSLEDSDCVKNAARGRSTRNSNRKIKTKKSREK